MKKIPLTQGQFALVDDEDFEKLNKHKWSAYKDRNTFYTISNLRLGVNRRTTIKMHRIVLGLTDSSIFVDHIDGNGLNNQKSNLRKVTHAENLRNLKAKKNCKSKYKGVTFHTVNKKWIARISINNKRIHLGSFVDEIEAAKAYDEASKIHHGEFGSLNFK